LALKLSHPSAESHFVRELLLGDALRKLKERLLGAELKPEFFMESTL
jgi:hypothetical protein